MKEPSTVALRPYRAEDYHHFRDLVSDPSVMKKVDGVLSTETIDRLFSCFIDGPEGFEDEVWAVTDGTSSHYLGHGALIQRVPGMRQKELIFYICEKHWAKGYGLAAANALVARGFTNTALESITATVDQGHTPSERILAALGFVLVEWETDQGVVFGNYLLTRTDHLNP